MLARPFPFACSKHNKYFKLTQAIFFYAPVKLFAVATILGLCCPVAFADQLSTVGGDTLTGRVVSVECAQLNFEFRNEQELHIPIAGILFAASQSPVEVVLSNGDRLTGRLLIQSGEIVVTSPLLGVIKLSIADLQTSRRCSTIVPAEEVGSAMIGDVNHSIGLADIRGRGQKDDESGDVAPNASTPESNSRSEPTAPSNSQTSGSNEDESEPYQFLRTEAVLLQPLRLEADLLLSYLRNGGTFQDDKVASILPSLRFGLLPNLEGFVQASYLWGERDVSTFVGQQKNETNGLGDTRFGLKYSLLPQTETMPNIVVDVSASAPTGQSPYIKPPPEANLNNLQVDNRDPLAIQLGLGHWSVSGGVTAIKSFDPLILFAGGSYTYYFPKKYYGIEVKPGALYSLQAGLGFAVNDTGTISSQLFAGYQNEWVFDGTHVSQTSASPVSLRFAYTHILGVNDLIEPSVLFGLTDDATDVVIGLAYSHTF